LKNEEFWVAGNVAQHSFSLCKNDENLVSLYSYTCVVWKKISMNLSFSHESVPCASQSFHEFGESSKDLCIIILDSICRWLAASQELGLVIISKV
jgi:hypothetical protein